MPTRLKLPLPRAFDLTQAVTTYGYFVLAPNHWDKATRTLHRPLTIHRQVVHTAITQAGLKRSSAQVRIQCDTTLPRAHHADVKRQVARMLHLDTPPGLYRRFWQLHPEARRVGFGRLFRSPTLFEDIIKTITGCNVAWTNTKTMNRLLCEKVGQGGAFPTPTELAGISPSQLKRKCKVGYRAERIIRFARDVETGKLDLAWFEDPKRSTDELYEALRAIYGIGDYAANNICQHLDRYDRLPIDSETIRHFRQVHDHDGDARQIADAARTFYQRYAPFQFLAYWYELWHRTSVGW